MIFIPRRKQEQSAEPLSPEWERRRQTQDWDKSHSTTEENTDLIVKYDGERVSTRRFALR